MSSRVALRLRRPDPDMAELNRHGWTSGMAVVSHGVRLGVRVDDPTILVRLPPYLPPGWRHMKSPVVDQLYSLETRRVSAKSEASPAYRLYEGSEIAREATTLDEALEGLQSHLDIQISTAAPSRVFVHAGVVEWRGRAIVIPGRSWSGKTTLVSALVRAGAGYYSDEFAVLDQRGRVHPYPRPLKLRGWPGRLKPHAARAVGRRSLPLGVVVVTEYRPRARWRPGVLSRSEMLLALLQHTVMVRAQPAATLRVLGRAVQDAQAIKGLARRGGRGGGEVVGHREGGGLMTPRARHNGMLSETVENELVVYDTERHKAHRLNRTAALVWRHADGEHSVADMAVLLQQELGPVADEDLVWCTLDRLNAAHLMETPGRRPIETARASRRQFVRKVGLVGALTLLLPAVTSIVAPTPVQAQSCILCECACECACECVCACIP